eukprot:scaffold114960_cov73-Phaeocystis_antarctica.AAC.1
MSCRTRECPSLAPQGDPRTGPRPIKGHLSVNKWSTKQGYSRPRNSVRTAHYFTGSQFSGMRAPT